MKSQVPERPFQPFIPPEDKTSRGPGLQISTLLGYWLPPLLWGAGVLAMSGDWGSAKHTLKLMKWLLSWVPSLSPAQIKLIHFYFRKAGHVLSYGILYVLWFRAFRGSLRYRLRKSFFWALGFCLIVALVDEGRQSLLTSRTGSIRDVALDLGGALLAGTLTGIFWQSRLRPVLDPETLASNRDS